MHRVTAAIVNYNDFENTSNAVRSLLQYTGEPSFRLFVVDNSPGEESAQKLRKEFPQIEVIRSAENRGFGAAHNMVLPYLDSEYHAVINPDIELKSDVIGELCNYLDRNPDVGIACPATYFPNGDIQLLPKIFPKVKYLLASRLPFEGCKALRREYVMADRDLSQAVDVEYVTGCFMFIRTGLFKRVGGFDERYFLYFEDADLTRMIMPFARAVYYPHAKVYHHWNRMGAKSPKYLLIQVSSMFKYFRKWNRKGKV